MKRKNTWIKGFLLVFPVSIIIGSVALNLQNKVNHNTSLLSKSEMELSKEKPANSINSSYSTSSLAKLSLDGQVTETASKFNFLANDKISWAGTKKAQYVTTTDLTMAVVPENIDAVFKIEIQSPEQNDYLNGIVRFKVIQSIRTFDNGVVTKITYQEIAPPSQSGSGTPFQNNTTNNVWQTPKGLVVEDKYKFAWRSNEEIGDFLSKTDLTPDKLTPEIVLNNLILQDQLHKVPDVANITVSVTDLTSTTPRQTMNDFGVCKLVVSFKGDGATASNWVNNTLPTDQEKTIILRGLVNSSGSKTTMEFNTTKLNVTTFKALEIDSANKSIFGNVLLDNEDTLGDLTPSELININNGNQNSLIDLFTKGEYLKTKEPIVGLYYMGLFSTNPNFANVTQLTAGIVSVNKIEAEPNDLDGSLKLIFQYSYYDVYYSKVLNKSYSYQFPPNTFKTNPDAQKTLSFEWKQDSAIANTFGSSHSIVNQFKQLNTPEEKAAFSNQFFIGSSDAYAKIDREISIDYKGGTKNDNGTWEPSSTTEEDKKTIEISIYFKTWNGLVSEKDNKKVDGFFTKQSFVLPTYKYTQGSVEWLTPSIDISNTLASKVAFDISKDLISQNQFFISRGLTDVNAIFFPDDSIGSLIVRVVGKVGSAQQFYENTFVGFKKSSLTESVVQVGWLPQTSVSSNLLNKSINQVTKAEVIDLLVSSNNLFANAILTENDIILVPDNQRNVITVEVKITFFNQDLPGTTRTQSFVTEIVGFSSTQITDNTVLPTPANITLIASVAAGGAVALVLLSILTYQIVRSVRFSLAKKSAKAKEGV